MTPGIVFDWSLRLLNSKANRNPFKQKSPPRWRSLNTKHGLHHTVRFPRHYKHATWSPTAGCGFHILDGGRKLLTTCHTLSKIILFRPDKYVNPTKLIKYQIPIYQISFWWMWTPCVKQLVQYGYFSRTTRWCCVIERDLIVLNACIYVIQNHS